VAVAEEKHTLYKTMEGTHVQNVHKDIMLQQKAVDKECREIHPKTIFSPLVVMLAYQLCLGFRAR
jgi:hypothetical protein